MFKFKNSCDLSLIGGKIKKQQQGQGQKIVVLKMGNGWRTVFVRGGIGFGWGRGRNGAGVICLLLYMES